MNPFLFITIQIFNTHFAKKPVLFAHLENINKLWNNNRTICVNEQSQNKSKTKTKPRHIQIDIEFYIV